jgi:hypothetical protein
MSVETARLSAVVPRSRTECPPRPSSHCSRPDKPLRALMRPNPCTCFVPASGVSCVSGDSRRRISLDFLAFSHGVPVQILSSASHSKLLSINYLQIANVAVPSSVVSKYLKDTNLQVRVLSLVSTAWI